jgi:serine/threonine protein kinase
VPKDRRTLRLILQALTELHARGILHGDIRAENVIVKVEGGIWKVMRCGPFRGFVAHPGSILKSSC